MVEIKDNVIRATQGDTIRTPVQLFTSLNPKVEYVPESGDTIRFALKGTPDPKDTKVLLNIPIPISTMELYIPAEETKKLKARKNPYFYDVEIVLANGDVCTFISNEYYSLPEVL